MKQTLGRRLEVIEDTCSRLRRLSEMFEPGRGTEVAAPMSGRPRAPTPGARASDEASDRVGWARPDGAAPARPAAMIAATPAAADLDWFEVVAEDAAHAAPAAGERAPAPARPARAPRPPERAASGLGRVGRRLASGGAAEVDDVARLLDAFAERWSEVARRAAPGTAAETSLEDGGRARLAAVVLERLQAGRVALALEAVDLHLAGLASADAPAAPRRPRARPAAERPRAAT